MGACTSSRSRLRHPLTVDINTIQASNIAVPIDRPLSKNRLPEIDSRLLQRSWTLLVNGGEADDLYEFGIEIYDQIFTAAPQITRYFPALAKSVSSSSIDRGEIDWRDVAEFRAHVLKLMKLFALCLRYCHDLDGIIDTLRDLGRRHRVYVGDVLIKIHFELVKNSSMLVIARRLDAEFSRRNMIETWDRLLDFVVDEIMLGYDTAKS